MAVRASSCRDFAPPESASYRTIVVVSSTRGPSSGQNALAGRSGSQLRSKRKSLINFGMAGQIVLLPHPGPERPPPRNRPGRCPWPSASAKHRRKWLSCDGEYLADVSSAPARGTLGVWCEYEAPTFATEATGAASWLHRIDATALLTPPSRDELNTDPWIWHPGFLWSICRQMLDKEMDVVKSLSPGDLVLFGSVIQKTKWCLDTLLVVETRLNSPPTQPAYDRFVKQPLYSSVLNPTKGRPWSAHPETFSFAPVQLENLRDAPARVDISTVVNSLQKDDGTHASAANAQALVACAHPDPNAVWRQVTDVVIASGMQLGISFVYPP